MSSARPLLPLEEKLRRLELVQRISLALSAERNRDRLLEMILVEAKTLCSADGGTLYLRTEEDTLRFAILRNDTLGLAQGGTTGKAIDLPEIPLFDRATGKALTRHVASHAAVHKRTINIADAYAASGFDFSGTVSFDQHHQYRSQSFLTIPMVNNDDHVIGVLQLINARDAQGAIVPFDADHEQVVSALASQAAVALDNQQLLAQQRELLESFIQAIANAIDEKSSHTGGHCERVPVLTLMLAQAVIDEEDGPLKDFTLSEDEFYELKIAAWMHDCGKVTTPVHVIDKSTKLEAIGDRIQHVRTRYAVLKRDAEITFLRGGDEPAYRAQLAQLDDELAMLEQVNSGKSPLTPEQRTRIEAIAARTYGEGDAQLPVLSADEVKNLCIAYGTLTGEERITINRHIVQTIRMLEALPFPRQLSRVPEYAGGHHERMDGKGYPRGVFAGDMSIPARIMAIADVFEALTAQDRPYKRGLSLSEAMRIMGNMKRDNHLDPDLFDVFVKSGTYRKFGERYLPATLLDTVDEASLLAVQAKEFELPPEAERLLRKQTFIAPYDD